MSYIVLARKWRPQKFDDVIGQEHIAQALGNSVLSGKLAQAYLFVGPRGVGKTSCARILAKSLNCKDAPTIKPCGKCPACREISEGISLDVIEIDGASNRGIDEIRTLRENVKFSPVLGKYKIYIIDEVHMLTPEAFNALLKTLEEPPEHVKFIFATTQPTKILPTILSRCQRFEFNRIPLLKIIAKLEEICKAESILINKDALFDIAKMSDGSMRDAESVLDQLITFSKNDIKAGDVIAVMGLIEQDAYFEFLEALKNKNAQFCIDFISKLFSKGKNIEKFFDGLLWHLRNIMLAKIMVNSNLEDLLDLPKEVIEKVVEQGKSLILQDIINMFTAVVNSQELAKKIGSFRIPLELMVVKLTHKDSQEKITAKEAIISSSAKTVPNKLRLDDINTAPSDLTKKDLNAKIQNHFAENVKEPDYNKNITDNVPQADINSDIKSPVATALEAPKIDFATMLHDWPKLIDAVSEKKMSVGTYLKDSRLVGLENGILTIGFSKKAVFYKEAVEQRHNQKVIIDMINELFNTMLSLKFELLENVGVQQETEEVENDFLKSAINTFGGRVFKKDG